MNKMRFLIRSVHAVIGIVLLVITAASTAFSADIAVGETVIYNDNISFVCVRIQKLDPYIEREICFDPYDDEDKVDIQACGIAHAGGIPYDTCTDWYPVDRVVVE